jgi:hypothetical protein
MPLVVDAAGTSSEDVEGSLASCRRRQRQSVEGLIPLRSAKAVTPRPEVA